MLAFREVVFPIEEPYRILMFPWPLYVPMSPDASPVQVTHASDAYRLLSPPTSRLLKSWISWSTAAFTGVEGEPLPELPPWHAVVVVVCAEPGVDAFGRK